MEPSQSERGEAPSELILGEWRVQPSLNRLTRGEATVRIEPKMMDVLVLLARRAGEVVSKDDIAGAVWPQLFISESVISRAIAGLRKALDDDAHSPRFIETIAKRGYRLLIRPAAATPEIPRSQTAMSPASPALPASFAFGQWVRGGRFHGRTAEIAEILDGPRNGLWVLGSRAIGKTSLLKHLESLTADDPAARYFPLFWDLQGSVEPDELNGDFLSALADAEDRLALLGLRLEEITAGDFFTSLARLRRALRAKGRMLLLLWDEVEELIHLHERSPALLRKLRRALQSSEGIRAVIASGPRLWKLAEQRDDTSPFLHGFAPPLYLGPLEDEAARGLVRRCESDAGTIEEILRRCGNHPSLLQRFCTRFGELRDLERTTESVAADPTIRFFFAVDFDLLLPVEQETVMGLARGEDGSHDDAISAHLERLGWVRRTGETREIASPILRQWLRSQKP
jgi:DNA-binding winged helix-turn-helix (wHTH) protein/plasmid replication initiation protein